MRIGIDIKAFKNGQTGIASYLRNLMDNLQILDTQNQYFLFEPRNIEYNISNGNWQKVSIHSRLPGVFWQQFILPFYLKKLAIDIIWAPEQIAPVFFSGGAKIVTTVYDLVAYRFPESCQKSNLYIQRLLFPRSLRKSSVILPISGYVKKELLAKFGFLNNKRLDVVALSGREWKIPDDYSRLKRKNYLLCVGNIEPRKNLVRLVKAFEKIEDPELKLVIVGPKGWKNTEFYRVVESSPKKDSIEIKGFVSEKELQLHYLTCKALMYPSIYEGFGIPVLEAFSMDCPVLTSRGSVMEEIAEDAALYVDPYDIEEIAAAIKKIGNLPPDPVLDHTKKINYFNDKYNWRKSALQIKNIWESLK